MATTTNYGWTTPDDTALVKDGAAAIRSLGSSIDSTLKTQIDAQIPDSLLTTKGDVIAASAASTPSRLAVGTNNQVLMADSTTATGLKYANEATATLTAKGDLLTATAANTLSRLGVGSNNQVLTADSTTATGLKWATPSSTPTWRGCIIYHNDPTVTAGTFELLAFTGELYDSDNYHSTVTNTSRITIPTGLGGYYLIQCSGQWGDATTDNTSRGITLMVNGVQKHTSSFIAKTSSTNPTWAGHQFNSIYYLAAADYIEFRAHNNDSANKPFYNSVGARGVASVTLLGA